LLKSADLAADLSANRRAGSPVRYSRDGPYRGSSAHRLSWVKHRCLLPATACRSTGQVSRRRFESTPQWGRLGV